MTKRVSSAEWTGVISGGDAVSVPRAVVTRLGLKPGSRVRVRLTRSRSEAALRRRGITDEEIDRIAEMQMEPRGQVVQFLLAEGALRRPGRRRPARPR